ncbi:MAG: thioredoxin-disulfide reductase [Bacteroidales bacterium]|nr:thioredoxin-disulfide reductase [Bacteroidales bacterium]
MHPDHHYDAIIIGAGPAGLTAGIYLSRARLKTLILTEGMAGGQLILTHEIANYPGVESVSGYQLANIMKKQAKSFGCEIKTNTISKKLDLSGAVKSVTLANGDTFTSHALILSPGGRPRNLNVPGEDRFKGRGISYCATCDGDFFTGKEITVVGGGNSALEEAVSLTRYASKVTIVHQFNHFQAYRHAVEEAQNNPRIDFMMESTIVEFYGKENLEGVKIKNINKGTIRQYKTDGVFIFIGYVPNTEFLDGLIEKNAMGEIQVSSQMETNVPGVFAAGDSVVKKYRQVTTAISDGTIAALSATEYINRIKQKTSRQILTSIS